MSETLIQFENVSMCYGQETVLRKVSFVLAHEEHLALMGASGCGKSTLFALLAGLLAPDEGRITIGGDLVSKSGALVVPPHRRGIGMVFQDLALWPNLSALENVVMGIPCDAELNRAERTLRAGQMLDLCEIGELAARKPATLSGGQQQRVALARAMAAQPRILLLDEPFGGLDLTLKPQLLDEIRNLAERFNITMILISHDPWEISTLCRRAMVLENHGIREEGALDILLHNPASQTMKAMAARISA